MHVRDLEFNLNYVETEQGVPALEPDLKNAQDAMTWANHIIIVHPLWWGSAPALLKGFLDRVLVSGFAYKYEKGRSIPLALLKGRTARMIITSDSPGWYLRWILGHGWKKIMQKQVFKLCGIWPAPIAFLGPVRTSSAELRADWLQKAAEWGRRGA
jgi:putative NADPH-quinone reductase